MRKFSDIISVIMAVATIMSSCSIKEDRSLCPCTLETDISAFPSYGHELTISGWNSEGSLFAAEIQSDSQPDTYKTSVPRGLVSYSACTGNSKPVKDGIVSIMAGEQADRLFAYDADVLCTYDTNKDTVKLHKEFCVMTIMLSGFKDYDMGNVDVTVTSETSGIRLDGMQPITGEFSYIPNADEHGWYNVILPRQVNDACSLKLDFGEDGTQEYAIGEALRDEGYDWTAEDLGDVFLTIDAEESTMLMDIKPWAGGYIIDR